MGKVRLDAFLVRQGYAASRARARRLIEIGAVRIAGKVVSKPGQRLAPDLKIEVRDSDFPYVSRGALKLESTLRAFTLAPTGVRALDVGAATGGFTDVLLCYGAKTVTTVDIGSGQLCSRLRADPRVAAWEQTDIRKIGWEALGAPFDWIVVDVSFISLTSLLAPLFPLVSREGLVLALVKPQFEVDRTSRNGSGVVQNAQVRKEAVARVRDRASTTGWASLATYPVPLLGEAGNQEYFVWLKPPPKRPLDD